MIQHDNINYSYIKVQCTPSICITFQGSDHGRIYRCRSDHKKVNEIINNDDI